MSALSEAEVLEPKSLGTWVQTDRTSSCKAGKNHAAFNPNWHLGGVLYGLKYALHNTVWKKCG